MTRTERQELAESKWEAALCWATVLAFTGFGKTNIGILAIRRLRRNDRTRSVIIVVPSENLMNQWKTRLEKEGLMVNTRIFIINTVANLKVPLDCHLLICDEIHRYAADTFKRVFDIVRAKFGLGLSARIERLDGKHSILLERMPVCDEITLAEGRKYGWTANFREYNIGLVMEPDDARQYTEYEQEYERMVGKFKQDFYLMQKCTTVKPAKDRYGNYVEPPSVKLAREYGWRGNTLSMAYTEMVANESRPRGQKVNIWGTNTTHPYHPDRISFWAVQGMRMMMLMKSFCVKHPWKVEVAEMIIRFFGRKTIVFSEVIETIEALYEKLGEEKCARYHSKVKKKTGMTLKATREQELLDVLEGRKPYLLAAKSVDEGFDWEEASLGIDTSRTSNPLQHTQRKGRISRYYQFPDGREKDGVYVNLYFAGTREEKWLFKAQDKGKGSQIVYLNTVEAMFELESEIGASNPN
jgi:superfamily II DNA or RNA helicase